MGEPVPQEKLPSHLAPQADEGEPGVGEKIGALAYGAGTGMAGGLGELEDFGANTLPRMLDPERPKEKLLFPNVEDTEKFLRKFGINPPREEVKGWRTTGDILGGLLPVGGSATRTLLGKTSKEGEKLAREAEKTGFKLSPAQVRENVPTGQHGSTFGGEHNQELANKLVSRGTGVEAEAVTPKYIGERIKDLGRQFDAVYKGKQFRVDQQAVDAVRGILDAEKSHVTGAEVGAVERAAQDIMGAFDKLKGGGSKSLAKPGEAAGTKFFIDGEALQRLRNALTEKARSTASRSDAHEIYNFVDKLDESVARNHPEVAAKLNDLRPKYRTSVILEELYRRRGGISEDGNVSLEKLGELLRGGKDAVRKGGADIDSLARMGRGTHLRALWQPSGPVATSDVDTLSRVLGTVNPQNLAAKLPGARMAQRVAGRGPKSGTLSGPLTSAGVAAQPFNPSNDQ